MQTNSENPQSLGICQRLFKLIMNGLFAKDLRRLTSGLPAPPEKSDPTNRIPEPEDSCSVQGASGSGIRVRFKESEDSECWDFWKVEKDDVDGGEGMKPVMDSGSGDVSSDKKKKNRRKVSIEMQEPKPKRQSYKHLFSVESNINEKTEAFIRHRKAKMTKTS